MDDICVWLVRAHLVVDLTGILDEDSLHKFSHSFVGKLYSNHTVDYNAMFNFLYAFGLCREKF